MGSFRRSATVAQRDGSAAAAQNGDSTPDTSPSHSPKSARAQHQLHLSPWGLMSYWGKRSRTKGVMRWRRLFFDFFVCFAVGLLTGFILFSTTGVNIEFASKHQSFSFHEDGIARRDAAVVVKQPPEEDLSLGIGTRDETTARALTQDVELVPRKLVIVVTPTHVRPFQAYYLNRLAHTLRVVPPPLVWLVVDMPDLVEETARILRETGLMYRHLVCDQNVTTVKDKSAYQRNVALSHIEKHQLDGVVLFADDYMMFSGDLFEHMRHIRHLGVWPVALLIKSKNKMLMEGPICNDTRVIGWHTDQKSRLSRRFYVDMSGFAFNSTILWEPKRWRRRTLEPIRQLDTVQRGFQETAFVEQLVEDESEMEGLPDGCSRIMSWHLYMEAPKLIYPNGWSVQKNLEVVAPLT